MAHARTTIRTAVMTACTGLTTTGSNISSSRVYAHEDLPSLAVYTDNELVTEQSGQMQWRDLTLIVEGRAQAATDVDDTLDTICAEVETALGGDSALAALCTCTYAGVDIEYSGAGDQPVALAHISFVLQYQVNESDPTTII